METTNIDMLPSHRPVLTSAGWLCIALSLIGCLAVFNATFHLDNPYRHVGEQALWILPAALVLIGCTRCPRQWFWKTIPPLTVLAYAAVWAGLLFGIHVDNGPGWFNVAGVYIEPIELAKPFFAICIAWIIHRTDRHNDDWLTGFTPVAATLILWIVPMLVNPDPGSVVVYLVAFIIIMLCCHRPARQKTAFISFATIIILTVYILAAANDSGDNSNTLSTPGSTATWHTEQFQRALAAGGVFGSSLGHGMWSRVSFQYGYRDSVVATLGEALGFMGLWPLIMLLLAWVLHGHRQCCAATDNLCAYAIIMLVSIPAAQAFIHLSVNLGVLPAFSVPLPLISYGGSSLIATFAIVGLVENISTNVD